jgi:hypothetical protein
MKTAPPPSKRRRWVRVLVMLLFVLAAGAAGGIRFIHARRSHNGTRTSLVWPGEGPPLIWEAGRDLLEPIALSPELATAGAHATDEGMNGEMEQIFIFRRENTFRVVTLTAGNKPLDTARLGYVLFDDAGNVLNRGGLRPALQIAAGQSESVRIADLEAFNAARIEIRTLP